MRRWYDCLSKLVNSYNNTVHSSIDRTPNSVTKRNAREVFDYEEQKRKFFKKKKRYARYVIGDLVRIWESAVPGYKPNAFQKSARAKWTKQLYKVVQIHYGTYVPMFTLLDEKGIRLNRRFYESELNQVKHSSDT